MTADYLKHVYMKNLGTSLERRQIKGKRNLDMTY